MSENLKCCVECSEPCPEDMHLGCLIRAAYLASLRPSAPPAPDSGPVWTVIQKPIPGSSDAKHTALSGPLGDIFFSSTQDAQNAAFECNQAFKHGAASKQAEVEGLVKAAQEVWSSVPGSYGPDDPMVMRHSRALNELHAALSNLGKG